MNELIEFRESTVEGLNVSQTQGCIRLTDQTFRSRLLLAENFEAGSFSK
jgi:hypothetical protein